jgi:hypothetical protein
LKISDVSLPRDEEVEKRKNGTDNTLDAEKPIGSSTIRFGIVCGGTMFAAWQAACLQKLLDLGYVKLALLIVEKDDNSSVFTSKRMRKLKLREVLWSVYHNFFVKRRSRALHMVDMSGKLAQVPSMSCEVAYKEKSYQYFSEHDVREIRKHNLDFILQFGSSNVRGEILNSSRFGIWAFHHGDEQKYRGAPPGFWEIYKGDNVTGATLQRLTDRPGEGIILKNGFFKTIGTSYTRNIDATYFGSVDWPAQVCIDIRNGAGYYLEASSSQTMAPIFCEPSNLQVLIFSVRVVFNILKVLYDRLLFYDEWGIGIVDKPANVFLKPGVRPEVQWLPPSIITEYGADPFVIRKGNHLHLFFEQFDFRMSKGCISTTRLSKTSMPQSKVAINEPFHMSYPYLLQHEGEIYCVPETYQAKQVRLYKAIDFPESWVLVKNLIEGAAVVDSTIFQHNGYWWLFANDGDSCSNFILKVWYAQSLFGPWKPHANNPVKVDIRSARPAGTPFMHNGDLYRPSQDNSKRYGQRIVINRVTCLTPTEFKEEQVCVIEPYLNSPYPDGIHTLSAADQVTIIDGMKHSFVVKSRVMLLCKLRAALACIRQYNAMRCLLRTCDN